MKFRVTMKDPDTLHDAITDAVKESLEAIPQLDAKERERLSDRRAGLVLDDDRQRRAVHPLDHFDCRRMTDTIIERVAQAIAEVPRVFIRQDWNPSSQHEVCRYGNPDADEAEIVECKHSARSSPLTI